MRSTSYGTTPAPSFPDYQSYYQPPYETTALSGSPSTIPPTSSGFVPVNSTAPTPSSSYHSLPLSNSTSTGSSYVPTHSHVYGPGYAPSVSSTPAPSGFVNPAAYAPASAPTPTPSSFTTPHQPPSSSGLHLPPPQTISQPYQYSSYVPPHPASAPPQSFPSSNLPTPQPSFLCLPQRPHSRSTSKRSIVNYHSKLSIHRDSPSSLFRSPRYLR